MSTFSPFPRPNTCAGTERRCGVEIELAGLSEQAVADLVAAHLGGDISDRVENSVTVKGTRIGDVLVELDTTLRKSKDIPMLETALDLVRGLVPVEIVTEPLTLAEVKDLDRFRDVLRDAGAMGSRGGVLLGFGVHLNPEITGPDDPFTIKTILAYGLLEPWLRDHEKLDTTRRAMPFVKPWPKTFVDALVDAGRIDLSELIPIYAAHVKSRNHGLDLLPLLTEIDEVAVHRHFAEDKTTSRPTFHFRMPDSRIDEADWSLARPWQLWITVERLAASDSALTELTEAWRAKETGLFSNDKWIGVTDRVLTKHQLTETP